MNSHKNNWKSRVEAGFAQLGFAIGRRPWRWLLGCLLIIGLMASKLPDIRQDTTIEGFLEEGATEIQQYDRFKDIFGRDEVFIVSVEVDDIFTQEFADKFRALHQQIEDEVPYVKTVDSLINARYTYGADDTLYIEELLPVKLPTDPAELEKLKNYTFDNPNYVNFLISEDRHLLALVVRLEAYRYVKDDNGEIQEKYMENEHMQASLAKLYEVAEQHEGIVSHDIRLAGSMPISLMLGKIMERDFTVFTSLANLLIGIVLFIIFRRLSGVFMPIIVMALGVIVTLSLMAIGDTPMQVSTSILPSFLLAVCVGDSIHLLTIFYRNYDEGQEKIHALANAMEHTGLAIFFTSITTAAGLASFATSELTPVSALGLYGALGSLVAFLLTVFILPCLISLLPLKRRPVVKETSRGLQSILHWCARFSVSYPKTIVGVGMAVFLVTGVIASQSRFSHHPLTWMPEDSPALQAIIKQEERMGASLNIEVMLDTGTERGINNPAFMRALDQVQQEVEGWQTDTYRVVKTLSVANIVKESNRALHDNDDRHFSIPDDPALISQELFLVELDEPDDLYNMIDRRYQIARLTIMIPWIDAIHATELLERFRPYIQQKMEPYTEEIVITGVTPVLGATFAKMLYSTAESYGFAAIAITLMMILLIGSFKLGLLSMIPSLLPIMIVLAIIRLAGVPLDMLTMLIGSIAIGLTVDDNVHFMHGFRRLYTKTGDPAYAIEKTLLSTGRAMLITSVVLSIGFFIYTQSEMKNMISFGLMTAFCIILALLATFLLAPALMMLANKTWHHQADSPHDHQEKKEKPRKDGQDAEQQSVTSPVS
ncbi:MAG: MMPL family transporter [Ketobacteraceae bacterium]|nr:MMPL family transporter [Ketobacteraceae bacterium]